MNGEEGRAGGLAMPPAILVRNVQPLVAAGVLEWPESWIPEGGWPAELAQGRIHDITLEGNRITGAVGIGIELVDVENVRVLDNEIEVRPAAERSGSALRHRGPARRRPPQK